MKITLVSPQGRRQTCDAAALLTPALREAARIESNQWIKRLRLVRYGAETMRGRFAFRETSLWWFTELFLHKRRRLDAALETILALDAAREQGAASLELDASDEVRRIAAIAFSRSSGVPVTTAPAEVQPREHVWPGTLVGLTNRLARVRPKLERPARARVAAFVHTAFWHTPAPDGEGYIGPILDALIEATSAGDVAFVGLGPRRNFRARRWWDPVAPRSAGGPPVTAIERLIPRDATRESYRFWQSRQALARDLVSGPDVRAAGVVRGCDLWPILKHELTGAALVQWPWSARTMDEAGAAIDVLEPAVVVTYAEAGGWGRALMVEARRRGVASAGIQHGFIYRHWLNYLHEADEMAPSPAFPRPDVTLLYDRYAAEHLTTAGSFPASSLRVTGSARLEALAARLAGLRGQRDALRARHGVPAHGALAVLTSKHSEIRAELPALLDAVEQVPGLRLVVKPHPAETPAVYEAAVAGRSRTSVAPAAADLAELLAAADVIVSMNSTVAIDGLVLGIPALVVGLPNNLSPFVEAGVMAGATGPEAIGQALRAVLYDRQVRHSLAERGRVFAERYDLAPRPGAAARAAHEILSLAATSQADKDRA